MSGVLSGSGRHRVWKDLFEDTSLTEVLKEKCHQLSEIISQTSSARNLQLKEKNWQIDAAANAILGSDVCVVAPTGEGKSFCYQLVALCCRERTVLVVTPLVALGKDQVSAVTLTHMLGIIVTSFRYVPVSTWALAHVG